MSKPLEQICQEFLADPTRNPRTGRKIKEGGKVYKELQEMCAYYMQKSLETFFATSPIIEPEPEPEPQPEQQPMPSIGIIPTSEPAFATPTTVSVPRLQVKQEPKPLQVEQLKHSYVLPVIATTRLEVEPISRTIDEVMMITGTSPALSYQDDDEEETTLLDSVANHTDARKLLLSDIQFLTRIVEPGRAANYRVIYVDPISPQQLNELVNLFPGLYVEAYNSERFNDDFEGLPNNITLHNRSFDDLDAKLWEKDKTKPILFISNSDDMDTQAKWVEMINPRSSLLKFDPADRGPNFEYFEGELFKEAWAKDGSIVTRLVPRIPLRRGAWDVDRYLGQMKYHDVEIKGNMNFDETLENKILSDFIDKFSEQPPTEENVKDLSDSVTRNLL